MRLNASARAHAMRRSRRAARGIAGAFALGGAVMVIAACGSSSSSGGGSGKSGGGASKLPSTVKLGLLDTLSGQAAFCGVDERQGAELAVSQINSTHFLGNTKLSLSIQDDKGTPQDGIAGLQQLISQKVAAIIGPCIGPVALATDPVAQQKQLPDIVTTASGADISPSYIFRAGIPQTQYAANVIKVLKAHGIKKVSVIYDNSQPSISKAVWAQTQEPALKAAGIQVISAQGANGATNSDFSAQVTQAMHGNPDAIGVLFQGAPNLTILRDLRSAGYHKQVWGQQGMLLPFFIDGGTDVQGTLISVSYSPALAAGASETFTKVYKAKYHTNPTELSAHGYDGVYMAARGLKAAGSTSGPALQTALAGIHGFEGAQGHLTFTSQGDARGAGGVVQVKGNELVGVKTP